MTFKLATMLRESAAANPTKPAVLFDGGALTFAELDGLSDRFAAGLRREGITPHQAVVLQLPNLPQFLIAYCGISRPVRWSFP
jgi:long-chain acyl-CoA synthetase